jgi:hypothetical protein
MLTCAGAGMTEICAGAAAGGASSFEHAASNMQQAPSASERTRDVMDCKIAVVDVVASTTAVACATRT